MITDIEMGVLTTLIGQCEDEVSKKIVGTVQDMMAELDVGGFATLEEEEEFVAEFAESINDVAARAVENGDVRRRMVGDYEIVCSFDYGDREIFIGEKLHATGEDVRYVVGDIVSNDFFERYEDCMGGDCYAEIAELYAKRISEQVQRVQEDLAKFPYDRTVIGIESCDSIAERDIKGEMIVVKPEAIRREYAGADRQLWVATGGFGCSPQGVGQKVFCKNVYTGDESVWLRSDILGTIKPECVPEWAKIDGLISRAKENTAAVRQHSNIEREIDI